MDVVVTVAVEMVNALSPGDAHGRAYQAAGGGPSGAAAVTAALRAGGARSRGR